MSKKRRYNWIPDLPDQRDFAYLALRPPPTKSLPRKVDLRAKCSGVENQGQMGSCTGNALAGVLEFLEIRELKDREPDAGQSEVYDSGKFNEISRLFIYYN